MFKMKGIKNHLYSLAGLPMPKKTRKFKTKKTTKKRRKSPTSKKLTQIRPVNEFKEGFTDILKAAEAWKKFNVGKVYIGPYRLHHGLVFTIIGLLGYHYNIDYLKGAGWAGALDDIPDLPDWLNFRDR